MTPLSGILTKVVALMLRSHTVVLAAPVEALGSVTWKKACPVPVEHEWRVGLYASYLEPLEPTEVGKKHVGFCSERCRKQAEKIRYVRQTIHDGRSTDPLTALFISSIMITLLAFDLAYTRPRLSNELCQEVLAQNDGRCVSCNERRATEVDHINGGSIELSNLRGLCRRCHVLKARGEIPDGIHWRTEWPRYRRACREWAKEESIQNKTKLQHLHKSL